MAPRPNTALDTIKAVLHLRVIPGEVRTQTGAGRLLTQAALRLLKEPQRQLGTPLLMRKENRVKRAKEGGIDSRISSIQVFRGTLLAEVAVAVICRTRDRETVAVDSWEAINSTCSSNLLKSCPQAR